MKQLPELMTSHKILRFQRSGIDAQKLVKAIRQVTKDEMEMAMLIDAIMAYTKGLQRLQARRGPFDMKANETKRPDPFIRLRKKGGKFMLPRFYR